MKFLISLLLGLACLTMVGCGKSGDLSLPAKLIDSEHPN